MKTINELIDEHCNLFIAGSDAHHLFMHDAYEGTADEYYACESSILRRMLALEAEIESLSNNEPQNHE